MLSIVPFAACAALSTLSPALNPTQRVRRTRQIVEQNQVATLVKSDTGFYVISAMSVANVQQSPK